MSANKITEKMIADAWNFGADGFNQWTDLGTDEKVEFAFKFGRDHRCGGLDYLFEEIKANKEVFVSGRSREQDDANEPRYEICITGPERLLHQVRDIFWHEEEADI
jgi:hypothetical protein